MRTQLLLIMVLLNYSAVQAMSGGAEESHADCVKRREQEVRLSRALENWRPKKPDLEALEVILNRGVSCDTLSKELGKCLWRRSISSIEDFNKWLPAMQLLVSYGADPDRQNGVHKDLFLGDHTLLLEILNLGNYCKNWKIPHYRQAIAFLIKAGASISRRNEAGENAIRLSLNPSSIDMRKSEVCSPERRLDQYYWFKKAVASILSENNRIEELELLEDYRFPEEEKEAQRCIKDALNYVFCTDIIEIVGGYARAKPLELHHYGNKSNDTNSLCAIS